MCEYCVVAAVVVVLLIMLMFCQGSELFSNLYTSGATLRDIGTVFSSTDQDIKNTPYV